MTQPAFAANDNAGVASFVLCLLDLRWRFHRGHGHGYGALPLGEWRTTFVNFTGWFRHRRQHGVRCAKDARLQVVMRKQVVEPLR